MCSVYIRMYQGYKITLFVTVILLLLYALANRDQIKINLLNHLVVLRGILSPNCAWYGVSDLLLDDGAGVNLYNEYKRKHGDFAVTSMFGENIYLVTNHRHIKEILDQSPHIFSVGKLKKRFFQAFMSKNSHQYVPSRLNPESMLSLCTLPPA